MGEGVLVPPYRRIADEIRGRIAAGELQPGDLVPSSRAITREWGVAIATASKALAVLRDEGVTVARTGIGTVVAEPRGVRSGGHELTRERIVRAAIAVADADGLGELSMRRVAAELGVPTTSLYRHVPAKADLVLAMADTVVADHPLPGRRAAGWRSQLERCARRQWQVYRTHPWLAAALPVARPDPGVLRALDGTGLSPDASRDVGLVLFSYLRGIAGPQPAGADADRLLEFGLARLLDGVAALISSAARSRS